MKKQALWVLGAAGALAAGAGTLSSANGGGFYAGAAGTVLAASVLSPSKAAGDAVHAVGGGYAMHTSMDHYYGVRVYDVHVLYRKTLWDVKVGMTGTIMQKKLALEQPGSPPTPTPSTGSGESAPTSPHNIQSSPVSSAKAGTIAVHVVGGGIVFHMSSDHEHGVPIWDVHVLDHHQMWDVKVNQRTGAIMTKKRSSEKSTNSESRGQSPDQNSTPDN